MDAVIDKKAMFEEKTKLLDDAVALKETHRVPTAYSAMFWHARYGGETVRRAMYDYDWLAETTLKIVADLDPDGVNPPHMINALGPTMDLIGYKQLEWPGHGVDEYSGYQYVDAEYMKPEEYDDFIMDPSWFYLTKFMPRVAEIYAPFAKLPQFPAFQHTRMIQMSRFFANPELQASFDRLGKAGEEMLRMFARAGRFIDELKALGYPLSQSTTSAAPYDYFADYLRGSKGIMLDIFRRKDKLLEAMERLVPILIRNGVLAIQPFECKVMFMPMHWGLDGFMSLDQFKTFFWPQLRKVMMGFIDNGIVPLILWEGDCASRLETIADIPQGKCIYWFERTDLRLAKAVLGGHVCLRGNVPPSLFNTGNPDDVTEYCRGLIKDVGKGGGFILDGGVGIPDEAKIENARAMYQAAKRFAPGAG
jgi:hypothetical protein